MDGAPIKGWKGGKGEGKKRSWFETDSLYPSPGETIPVRVFLERYKLTPTYNAIAKKFDVKYYLKLSLVDETNRRFFKNGECGKIGG